MFKHRHLFDFSNYPKDSKLFDKANKKVIGKIKDVKELSWMSRNVSFWRFL